MMTLTPHEVKELGRCAQAMYRRGQNAMGHLLSSVAASVRVPEARYHVAMAHYRAWLVFDEPKGGA